MATDIKRSKKIKETRKNGLRTNQPTLIMEPTPENTYSKHIIDTLPYRTAKVEYLCYIYDTALNFEMRHIDALYLLTSVCQPMS